RSARRRSESAKAERRAREDVLGGRLAALVADDVGLFELRSACVVLAAAAREERGEGRDPAARDHVARGDDHEARLGDGGLGARALIGREAEDEPSARPEGGAGRRAIVPDVAAELEPSVRALGVGRYDAVLRIEVR